MLYAASKSISGKDVSRAQTMNKNKIMNSWGKNKDGKAWTVQYNGETYTVNFNVEVTVDNQAFFIFQAALPFLIQDGNVI